MFSPIEPALGASVPKPRPKRKPKPKPAKKSPQKGKPKRVRSSSLEALARTRPQEVLLTTQHCINGVNYGPGRVRVRGDIAEVLRENEQTARQVEQDFKEKRAFIVGPRGQRRQVPYDSFDFTFGAAAPVPLSAF